VGAGVGIGVGTGVGTGVGGAAVGVKVGKRVGDADGEGLADAGRDAVVVGVFGVPTAATTITGTHNPATTTDTITLATMDHPGRFVHRRYSPHGKTNTSIAIVHHVERYHGLAPEGPPVGRS
jgi:hypothetical protein